MRRIDIAPEIIAECCRRWYITRLSLFGSVLRDDFGPESDVDVLVEFEPEHIPGLAFITIQDELSALFGGRPVDLVHRSFLNHRLRARILAQEDVLRPQNPLAFRSRNHSRWMR